MNGIFITGTDTNVGKTFVTSRLAKHLLTTGKRVGIYKPACSGSFQDADSSEPRWEDLELAYEALEGQFDRQLICPQTFHAPLAPPAAARAEGNTIDENRLYEGVHQWESKADLLLIEGVGGWKCPLTDHITIADFAKKLGFPVMIVADNRLGMINHTLLTIESIQAAGLNLKGIILNSATASADLSVKSNALTLANHTDVPILTTIPYAATDTAGLFASIDW